MPAFLLGLLLNAMPGAILAESLRRGLRGGFSPAFAVQIGSLAGDLIWANSRAFSVFLAGFMASSVLGCFICAGRLLNFGCAAGLAYFTTSVPRRRVISG